MKINLTDAELELMTILWKLGQGSVNEVMAELPKGRDLAYTSVSTILRILEQKQILTTRKEGRGHLYIPKITKAEYEEATIEKVVAKVFDGSAAVSQALRSLLRISATSRRRTRPAGGRTSSPRR